MRLAAWTDACVFVLHSALAAAASVHALLHKRDPRSAWGWILASVFVPVLGSIAYGMFGINRAARRARREWGSSSLGMPEDLRDPDVQITGVDSRELAELIRLGRALAGRALLEGNCITPLHNGEQAYPQMVHAIESARENVWLMTYLFDDGQVGHQFARALRDAQDRGVQVRVLLDGFGDLSRRPRGSALLREWKVESQLFLPLRWVPPQIRFNLRNHRKLLSVDGATAFVGGMNIGDHQLIGLAGAARSTRRSIAVDLHFKVEGPVVAQLDRIFADDWSIAVGERLEPRPAPPARLGDARCRALADGPNQRVGQIQMMIQGALANAHRSVRIMTPYFIPTPELASALTAAAMRGVEVSLIIPESTDHPWLDAAARRWIAEFAHSPMNIFRRAAPFAHTKLLLVDDYFALIGSANLDTRSLRLNFELMLEVYDRRLVIQLARHFESVRQSCSRADPRRWRSRSCLARMTDSVAWLCSPYL